MLLTMFCWTEILPKKVWEAFWANPRLPRQFLVCVILERFVNFLDEPYYQPLLWFMIIIIIIWRNRHFCKSLKSRKWFFMLLTMFRWTEVFPKKVWEANPCLLVCVILECFVNFLDDPYYKPLQWFMILYLNIIYLNTFYHSLKSILYISIMNCLHRVALN